MPSDPGAELDWRDGVIPVSTRFDDPYFSLNDGLAETRHVFLQGNRLADRLCDGFHVAELGFGTGLNLLALHLLWSGLRRPGTLRFTSFEAFPMTADDMDRALRHFPEAHAAATPMLDQWSRPDEGLCRIELPGLSARIILGDARTTLPLWQGRADAWFLDGFSPAKNPELWAADLMAEVAAHTAPGGSFATYTAAGHVRRALETAGFAVTRAPGHGRKRHMSTGTLRGLA
ncbi:tRNA (5-methylaminomethyl-2-thiouridine)(34)-methyltransferase MnmD [Gemmobacter denitrificans]|uniref:tRNA (5-methylaminomethyl-2-thiouridine)(34)-methyltransferase MnmD n=1 Tax=Gemmobacter denitrificans TaxID=3123040 RepID=A0ABU8BTC1_9RHOB